MHQCAPIVNSQIHTHKQPPIQYMTTTPIYSSIFVPHTDTNLFNAFNHFIWIRYCIYILLYTMEIHLKFCVGFAVFNRFLSSHPFETDLHIFAVNCHRHCVVYVSVLQSKPMTYNRANCDVCVLLDQIGPFNLQWNRLLFWYTYRYVSWLPIWCFRIYMAVSCLSIYHREYWIDPE